MSGNERVGVYFIHDDESELQPNAEAMDRNAGADGETYSGDCRGGA
jgi:hypothetical protein